MRACDLSFSSSWDPPDDNPPPPLFLRVVFAHVLIDHLRPCIARVLMDGVTVIQGYLAG